MVNTVKFSQFVQGSVTDPNLIDVGLSSGANIQLKKFTTWTLSTRPATPYNGLLGFNSETEEYEYWNSLSSAWIGIAAGGVGVTQVNTGTGLVGGPITATGTISFAPIAAHSFWANNTGGVAVPTVMSLSSFLLSTNNLSDLTNAGTARSNLGVAIGTNVEAWSMLLDEIAAGIWPGATSITTLGTITTGTWHGTTIDVAHGGSGNISFTPYTLLVAGTSGTAPFQNVASVGTAGQVLTSNGAAALPTFQNSTGTGTVNPGLINQLAYYAAAGTTLSGLATGASGTLVTDAGGVPSISSTLPTTVQGNITSLGTITAGVWHGTPVTVPFGGTGDSSFTAYAVICGGTSSTGALQSIASVGLSGQVLTSNGAAALPTFQNATGTGTVNSGLQNQLAYYAANGTTVSGLATANDGLLVTNNSGVPSILAGPGTTGQILQANAASAPSFSTAAYPSIASTSGKVLASNGTDFVQSTATFPVASAAAGKIIISDGTNWLASTPTYPNTSATAGKVIISDGTNNVYSTPTFPNTSAASGKFIQSDGTNWVSSGPTLPTTASTSGKILQSDGTNFVQSTPTYPSASGTAGQIIRSNGTNNLYSTATFADTYTASNLLYSNGANTVTGLATANNGTLITSGAGVPSISSTLPSAVQANITQLGTVSTVGGALNMSSFQINNVATPTASGDAVNKAYADSIAGGFNPIAGVIAASTGALTVTYNNGVSGVGATLTNNGAQATFALDGVNPSVNQRVLIKDQSSAFQNGLYTVTNVGSGASNWVLTRATDYNMPNEINPGDLVFVETGTVNAGSSWYETATVTVIGTDAISFSPFFTPATYLKVANNLSDVASASTSFGNISPLTTKGDLLTYSTVNARLAVGTINGQILQVNSATATGLAWSTPTYPASSGASGKFLISDGTNNVYSTSTIPTSAGATANKVLLSDGTNYILSTPTFPNASASTGKFIQSDGTNWIASTPTLPATAGTSGKVLISDGTNFVSSTPTFPNASATTRKIIVSDGTNWVASTETYAVPGTSGNVLTSDGTNWTSAAPGAILLGQVTEGRLTLTTATPVTTSDVTAATTIYFTPYTGNYISLYDGSSVWNTISFSEISIAVPSTTSTMYDIFCFNNSGTATLETLAWTNDTTRATALVLQNGRYVKSGATTRLYLGSVRTTTVSGQTEDSLTKRYLWNYYNRVIRPMIRVESTASWTYSTATYRQTNGSTSNQLDTIIGVAEDVISITAISEFSSSAATVRECTIGIGLGSTTVNSATIFGQGFGSSTTGISFNCNYNAIPAIGRLFYAWLERGAGADTQTWSGTNAGQAGFIQTGIVGFLRG
jgi:hypothetical protein